MEREEGSSCQDTDLVENKPPGPMKVHKRKYTKFTGYPGHAEGVQEECEDQAGRSGGELQLLVCQKDTMDVVAGCVVQGRTVVITGPSQGGKTAIMPLVAQLVGVELETVGGQQAGDLRVGGQWACWCYD